MSPDSAAGMQRVAEHRDEQAAASARVVLGGAERDVDVHPEVRRDAPRGARRVVEDERGAVLEPGRRTDAGSRA